MSHVIGQNFMMPWGEQNFITPLTLNVPLGFASGKIEGLGETKLTVSLGANH